MFIVRPPGLQYSDETPEQALESEALREVDLAEPRSLFRRNVPITRRAIDEVLAETTKVTQSCEPDCGRCSGEYCDTHGVDPCDCDVIDRHQSEQDKDILTPGEGRAIDNELPWDD